MSLVRGVWALQWTKPFRRPWLWAGLWLLLIATIVIGSLLPSGDLTSLPRVSDKLQHFAGYFVLAAGAVQLFARTRALLLACLALIALGLGLEVAQGLLTSSRMMDARDALANLLGVLTGLATRLTPLRDLVLRIDGGKRR